MKFTIDTDVLLDRAKVSSATASALAKRKLNQTKATTAEVLNNTANKLVPMDGINDATDDNSDWDDYLENN